MDSETIANELLSIGADIQKKLFNNPHQWVGELATRQALLARVAGITPQAERNYLSAFATNSEKRAKDSMAANLKEKLIKADCRNEIFLLSSSEQLFKTLLVQIDALRTLISQAKSERGAT